MSLCAKRKPLREGAKRTVLYGDACWQWFRFYCGRGWAVFDNLERTSRIEIILIALVDDAIPSAFKRQHLVFLAVKQGKGRAFSDELDYHDLPIVVLLYLHFHTADRFLLVPMDLAWPAHAEVVDSGGASTL